MENRDQILKWLNGELTPEELADFKITKDYQQLKPIVENSSHFEAPAFDEDANYRKLKEIMDNGEVESKESFGRFMYLKIAAVLVVVLATGMFFFLNKQERISTGTAEITLLDLPDESSIILNSDSRISYQPEIWGSERTIKLVGEAFFKVETGGDFTVKTENGKVKVVGTAFNVRSRNDEFRVWCYEGAVKVSFGDKEFLLKERQAFFGTQDTISKVLKFNEEIPVWAIQESTFEAVPLREVIRELEEQFDIEISTKNVNLEQLFTGSFSHSDMELALKAVTVPLQLQYVTEADKKIVLYEE
ncbi:FecR family protein [Salinimicrobium terrae]|uniref:FecR family protein n=1 Tax=Salinimicrobium terrae TaxID=470866 RepID=UPI0003F59752|nr:FecR domain-containing protein [Salinimicrobium terrae]